MAPSPSKKNNNDIPHSFPQNAEEKRALEEFRKILLPESEKWDDFYLLRWLRARDLNIPKAKEMLERYLTWRKANASILDNISSWTPPPEVIEKCPLKFTGTDEIGRPVLFELLGRWEIRQLIEMGYKDDLFPFLYQVLEEIHSRINKTRSSNPNVTSVRVVMDVDKITWWKIGTREVIQLCLKFFREFESYHPEILHSVYVINAHWIFQYIFSTVKPILSAKTLGKVHIYSKDRSTWEPVLQENIPSDALPIEYGGSGDKIIPPE